MAGASDFSWWARGVGIFSIAALMGTCIINFQANSISLGFTLYSFFLSLIIMLVELPACCTCFAACQALIKMLGPCHTYWWIRGVSYLVFGGAGIAIWVAEGHLPGKVVWVLVANIILIIAGILYVIAYFRSEAPSPEAPPAPAGAPKPEAQMTPEEKKESLAGSFFGFASSTPKEPKPFSEEAAAPLTPSEPESQPKDDYGHIGRDDDDDNPFSGGGSMEEVNPFA